MTKDVDEFKDLKGQHFKDSEEFVRAGDLWLRSLGIISPVAHNNIILNLYMNFPRAKYAEYFLDQENKYIEVHLHYGLWSYLTTSLSQLETDVQELLSQYLPNYKIATRKRRYRHTDERERTKSPNQTGHV